MIVMLTQAAEVAERLLQVESISVIGLLLAIICLLVYYIMKLKQEIKLKDEFIQGISEKFFVLAGKMEVLINQNSQK